MALQYLRKKTKVILIGTLILIIPAFLLFYGWEAARQPEGIPHIVARVGRTSITREEYLATLENLHHMHREFFGGVLSTEMEEQLERMALERLIERYLLLQEAKIRNIRVSEEEVITRFREHPLFLGEDGKFDREILVRISRLHPRFIEALERDIRTHLTIEKLRESITHSVEVSDDEAYEHFRLLGTEVRIKYVNLNPKTIEKKIEFSDEELFRYYEDNKNFFLTKSKVKIEYVVVPEKIVEGEEVLNEKAFRISLRLLENDNWESFAKEQNLIYGKTGFIAEEDLIPELKESTSIVRIAFALPTNEVSEPIRVENLGYAIVRVVNRKPPSVPPFEEIKDKVKERLVEERRVEIAQKKMKEIYVKLQEERTIEEVGEEFGLEVKETDYFSRGGFIEGIGFCHNITMEAFRLSKGEYSEPITTDRGVYIIQPIGTKEPTREEFEEFRESVKTELLHIRKEEVFREWLSQVREENKDRIVILWNELKDVH